MSGSLRPVFSRDLVDSGGDDHDLRQGAGSRSLSRLRRGAYVDSEAWEGADRDARYLARIRGVVGTRQSPVVLSHHSAARLWGLPVADGWPESVHITEPPDGARRSRNGVTVHRSTLGPDEITEIDRVPVTTLARTLVDLAADATFYDAIVALDAALWRRAPRINREDVAAALDARGSIRSLRRAWRAVDFATDLADSPGESWSRGLICDLGFPDPVLQSLVVTPEGDRFLDFDWPDYSVGGEFDGLVKYSLDPVSAVWREKLRENSLREAGRSSIARWTVLELRQPTRLHRRLTAAGLPSTLGTSHRRAR